MRFDGLSQPVSADSPSGPDLDEDFDNDYMNYVLSTDSRMPERYFTVSPSTNELIQFDGSTIDIAAETRTIAALLGRTRDIRLLAIDARFSALSGNIIACCEAIIGMSLIVTNFWDTFHPRAQDGDYLQRLNVVDGLDDQPRIVQPLQYANIAGGTRARAVTYRNFLVASGKVEPREGEERVSIEDIGRTLSGLNQRGDPVDELRTRVEEVYHAARATVEAIKAMSATFAEHVSSDFVPGLKILPETLNGIADLIATYRRDLAPAGPETAAEGGGDEDEDTGTGTGGAPRITGKVATHADARRALHAVERYLLFNEPSSPALILVHQSRLLIGRPLIEALGALMPEAAERAALRFDAGFRFDIDIGRMRSVTEALLANHQDELAARAAEDEAAPAQQESGWEDWNTWSEDAAAAPAEETPADGGEYASSDDSSAPAEDGAGTEYADGEPAAEAPAEDAAGWGADPEPEPEPAPEPAPAAEAPARPRPPPGFTATTRAEAGDLISATESFFRTAEPSSPLPVLLSRARGYMSRDFASILSELMPRETGE